MGEKCQILLLARTGLATFIIHGKTIQSTLKIPNKDTKPLNSKSLTNFLEEMRHICYILINEMSFVGPTLFMKIDSCL